MLRRPSVVVHPSHHFQRTSSPKPFGLSKPNFMWSLHGSGERKFVRGVWVTRPRWPPCPYMVKTLQKSLLQNQRDNDLAAWYVALGPWAHHSLLQSKQLNAWQPHRTPLLHENNTGRTPKIFSLFPEIILLAKAIKQYSCSPAPQKYSGMVLIIIFCFCTHQSF